MHIKFVYCSGCYQKQCKKFFNIWIRQYKKNKGYLFVSNHRDITLGSAFLNFSLRQNGYETTFNAVGNNLMSEKWASDLMRLNKSFIIDRSDKSKEIYIKVSILPQIYTDSILKNKSIGLLKEADQKIVMTLQTLQY